MVEESGMSPLMVASPMSAVAWGINFWSEQSGQLVGAS